VAKGEEKLRAKVNEIIARDTKLHAGLVKAAGLVPQ
jgi:hypothetical protein